jgi:hypothetical protein
MLGQILNNAGFLFKTSLSIWFLAWAIRYRYEVDEKLDGPAKAVRWGVVAVGYLIGSVPGSKLGWVRLVAGFTGLLFLCWPNFAYRLRNAFRTETSAEHDLGKLD